MYRVNQPSKNWGLEKKNDVILRSGSRRGGYTKSGAGKGGGGASKVKLHVKFVRPLFVTIWRSGTSLNHCKRLQECYMC